MYGGVDGRRPAGNADRRSLFFALALVRLHNRETYPPSWAIWKGLPMRLPNLTWQAWLMELIDMETECFVFPEPRLMQRDKGFYVLRNPHIFVPHEFMSAARQLGKLLLSLFGISSTIAVGEGEGIVFKKESLDVDEYRLEVVREGVTITFSTIQGAVYGAQTLLQLLQRDTAGFRLPFVTIADKPYKKYRGVHVYIPPKESIEGFKRLLDVLCFLKYNMVIIEVGGGMQYERHPEINRAWEWFCDTAENKFPGGPRRIQWADRYWKDSLHTELAGGSFLTKDEMRGIVHYAKSLGLMVIPELQALSHCYYLTIAHRDIAEQQDDPFPDTYCPSNEESYRLYFDIADEVIEVFAPEIVSIGHDEIRILGECPLCRGKTGHELLAYELNRLHEYYRQRGIRVAMWGEKLQLFTSCDGRLLGGTYNEKSDPYGRQWRVLATHDAIDRIPKDIIMLDWYHSLSSTTEDCFTERGFGVLFGNFHGSLFRNWDIRSRHVLGAEVSSWCLPDEPTLGRDGILFEFMFSAAMLWQSDCSDAAEQKIREAVWRSAPIVRGIARGYTTPLYQDNDYVIVYAGEQFISQVTLDKVTSIDRRVNVVLDKLDQLYGVPVDTGHIFVSVDRCARSLVFIQACVKKQKFIPSYEFPARAEFEIAAYAIFYEDGTVELANVHYGIHCADIAMDWMRTRRSPHDKASEIDEVTSTDGTKRDESPYFSVSDKWREAVSYFTTPIISGEKTLYASEWVNPAPAKKIAAIKAINTTKDREQTAILFAIVAIV